MKNKNVFFLISVILFSCTNRNENILKEKETNNRVLDNSKLLVNDSMNETKKFYAEIIVIENSYFIDDLKNLIKDNDCISRRTDLILDYSDKSGYILLWQSNVKNLVQIINAGNKNVYITFINNRPIFIVFKGSEELNLDIRKTGYKVDLSEYLDNYFLAAPELSYWHLKKKIGGGIEIVNEVLISCK